MNTIHPLGNRVLVKRVKKETSKGGILLPESSQEKPKQGVVLSVGEGKRNEQGILEAPQVKKGDTVLFGAYSGTEVPDTKEEDLLILSENDILCVIA